MLARRFFLWLAATAFIGAAAFWLLRPTPILVEVAVVTQGRFLATVTAEGRTRIRQRYVVSAPIAGRLERIRLKVGDRVEKDAVIAALKPNPPPLIDPRARRELEERLGAAEAQVEEAQALHAKAQAAREKASNDFARTRQLQLRGITSAMAFDRDKAADEQAARDLIAAERRIHAAFHQRAEAAEALRRSAEPMNSETFDLRAPAAGIVLRLMLESEAAVQSGAAIMELGDATDLEIIADPLTSDAVQMRPGAPVTIERWGGSQDLRGSLRLVEPSGFSKVSALGIEEQRTWVVIDLISPPDMRQTLGDGYRAEVRIVIEEIDNATLAPIGALFRRAQAWHVFVMDDRKARLRQIDVKRRSGSLAAIDGLEPGTSVIVFPPNSLSDGTAVRTP